MTDASPPSPHLPRRRACTNCTFSKAKCTPRTPTICERCQRLGKQCIYGPIASTRRLPGEKNVPARRVQRLEAKVQDLVTQLNTIKQQQPQDVHVSLSASDSTASSKSRDLSLARDSSHSEPQVENELETVDVSSLHAETHSPEYGEGEVDYILDDLGRSEEFLTIFRRDFCPEFPFVLLSSDETSASLRHDKPFLFMSIVAATSYTDPQLQRRLAREIQKQIASRMIINNEKSLDLLQGLLVCLAWYHYFLRDGSIQILLLLQLCVTLVNELGLTRDHSTRLTTRCDQVAETPAGLKSSPKSSSLSELRAFLGTFYLCSGFSTMFGNVEIMDYGDHVHRCCKRLTEASHLESDRWVARLVNFEILIRRVSTTFKYSSPEDSKIRGDDSICAIVNGFERELESLQVAAQGDAQGRESTLSQIVSFADAWIHEVAFHHSLWEMQSSGAASTRSQPLPNAQFRMLWQNLGTSKRYFDDFILVENDRLFHLTYVAWVRLCYMIAVCCKGVFCNIEKQPVLPADGGHGIVRELALPLPHQLGWDFLSAARMADFQRIGGLMENKCRSIGMEAERDDEPRDAMAQFAHCMGVIVSSYERQLQLVSSKCQGKVSSAQIDTARLDAAPLNVLTTESSPPQPDRQGTTNASELEWNVPMDFQIDNMEEILVWESLMRDFTALPQQ